MLDGRVRRTRKHSKHSLRVVFMRHWSLCFGDGMGRAFRLRQRSICACVSHCHCSLMTGNAVLVLICSDEAFYAQWPCALVQAKLQCQLPTCKCHASHAVEEVAKACNMKLFQLKHKRWDPCRKGCLVGDSQNRLGQKLPLWARFHQKLRRARGSGSKEQSRPGDHHLFGMERRRFKD